MKKYIYFTGLACLISLSGCEDEKNEHSAHNQGRNCIECHSFDSSGTVFTTLLGKTGSNKDAAKDYKIQLLLENNEKIILTQARGDGNVFWNGDVGAINNFTAQVTDKNGSIVNSSQKNSHNVGRLSCNACHTEKGLSGAPGRIVNYNYRLNPSSSIAK